MDFSALIRTIPDFPIPGILFRDITPLLAKPEAFRALIAHLAERYRGRKIDKVLGIESRGFIFGTPLACELGAGFVPARKPGKLPFKTIKEAYSLEYGQNIIELHEDAIAPGDRVLVIDDLIATGGTLAASCRLVEKLGGEVVEVATVIELSALKGRELLGGRPFYSVMQF